ncbi:MAG: family 78 glycoside hydrolase catalytic domain [bacterium]
MTLSNLRCEYAVNPIGLDAVCPRFSWVISSDKRGVVQTAYRVRVARAPDVLARGGADLWNSGMVKSADSFGVEYAGQTLLSRERYFWTVEVCDNHGERASAEPAFFEMGLLHPADWAATWIGFPGAWSGKGLLFRRCFDLKKPVSRARVYVSGLGYYELRINGCKVGDAVLEPAPTDNSRRVLYSVHDVTGLVREGANVVAAMLGNGWYGAPKLLVQMEITHPDGSRTDILTGEQAFCQWSVCAGPVVSNGVYDGEVYDARMERDGWDEPKEVGSPSAERTDGWMIVNCADAPGGKLVANCAEPIRVVATLHPERLTQVKPGVWVCDFGQNLAGWARIRVQGPRGTRIRLRFAESLYADGTVNQDNLRTARSEDVYILKGAGVEEWEPRFTYHGFRYVQVEGWPGEPVPDCMDGRVVRSDVSDRGEFSCDNELINTIYRNVRWTEAGNLHGIPTDCPQRDERMGWLNDMSARAEESIYNFDMVRFFTKWLDDIADAQTPDGALPDTVPFRFGYRPCDPVCVAFLLLPWLLYQHDGDKRLLNKHFSGMKKWVDYLFTRRVNGVLQYSHYGDWAPPVNQGEQNSSPINLSAPGPLVSTAFLFYHASLLAQIAGVIGEKSDALDYSRKAAEVKASFNGQFWDETIGGYGPGSQSCNTLALYFGLVPEHRVKRVVDRLVSEIERFDGHLATGNICTKYIMEVLAEHNRLDVAWRIVTQTTYPGWGFMIASGATTIWERWEQATGGGMNSHNHPMLASIGAWFYRVLAGVKVDDTVPGFGRFTVRIPEIDSLNESKARLETVRGRIDVAWRKSRFGCVVGVRVPVGSEARVLVAVPPGGRLLVDGTLLWGAGYAAGTIEGVRSVSEAGGILEVTLGSGQYQVEASA